MRTLAFSVLCLSAMGLNGCSVFPMDRPPTVFGLQNRRATAPSSSSSQGLAGKRFEVQRKVTGSIC